MNEKEEQLYDDFWNSDISTDQEKVREAALQMPTQQLLDNFASIKARIMAYEVSLLHYQFKFLPQEKVISLIIKARQQEDELYNELTRNGYELLDQLDNLCCTKIYIGDELPLYRQVDIADLERQIKAKDALIGQQIEIMKNMAAMVAV